eukprot:TRINITY_DN3069_c0_g1_i21.p1 TRINITY_DN3069_c0_g1~~TRINITY_DN3069_c0_g1_i21.p1  ORF type:complete len:379 (-),score=74.10 TRINITY_DN3069_c0_g1_i21:282-1346(-)
MATLPCCHLYCLSCLRSYVSLQLSGGLGSSTIKCPGFECPYELDETFLAELLDREDYVKYLRFVVNSNVQNDSRLNWCPGLGCNRVIMRSRPYGVVMCTCGYLWCWSCRDEGHWPASCEQQKWWTEVYCKNDKDLHIESPDETLSIQWLLTYTQDCPRCSSPIEKNGGCNHMSCTMCLYQYCWICKEVWKPEHYICGKHVVSENPRDRVVSCLDSRLTFRQLYVLNIKAKNSVDVEIKKKVIKFLEMNLGIISVQEIKSHFKLLAQLILCRHAILKLCIVGKCLQTSSLEGTGQVKKEIKRLASRISYTHSIIGSLFDKKHTRDDDLLLFIKGVEMDFHFLSRTVNILRSMEKS